MGGIDDVASHKSLVPNSLGGGHNRVELGGEAVQQDAGNRLKDLFNIF